MRTRSALALGLLGVVAVSGLAPASAAPPKNFQKTVTFTDGTPDPSGNANSSEAMHCDGRLPKENPIEVKLPGPGTLDVQLGGFAGDWSLQILDAGGNLLSGADVNPPDYELASVRLRKAGTVKIFPCNLTGTPQATVTYSYKYRP